MVTAVTYVPSHNKGSNVDKGEKIDVSDGKNKFSKYHGSSENIVSLEDCKLKTNLHHAGI